MVSVPTRHENVLDLFLTTNHTLVQETEILPGIADHDMSLVVRKPVFWVSDQVRHKPVCIATEDG